MGIVDFVKDAGEKLLKSVGIGDDGADGQAIEARVRELGLDVKDLSVGVNEETANVRGEAATQAVREKTVLVVGNVEGIAKVDDQLTVAAPEPEAQYYTVVSGDNLSKIAKEFYGDPNKYPVIFEANKPMLKDPDLIYPGQKLRIPPLDG